MKRQKSGTKVAIVTLARLCDTSAREIRLARKCVQNGGYNVWPKPKRSGGVRWLYAPKPELKRVQAVILKMLYQFPTHSHLFGYEYGRSPIDNALCHVSPTGQVPRWLLTIDLKDAFPSVKTELLAEMFDRLFLSVRRYFYANYRTKLAIQAYGRFKEILIELTTTEGMTPQGAPTSPRLFNLALVYSGVVKTVQDFCVGQDFVYRWSFYADDIAISACDAKHYQAKPITREEILRLIRFIDQSGWFTVNRKKVHLYHSRHLAPRITGVVITYDADHKAVLTLPKTTQNMLRGKIHRATMILQSGREPDMTQDGFTASQLAGYIGWVKTVCRGRALPSTLAKTIQRFDALLLGQN